MKNNNKALNKILDKLILIKKSQNQFYWDYVTVEKNEAGDCVKFVITYLNNDNSIVENAIAISKCSKLLATAKQDKDGAWKIKDRDILHGIRDVLNSEVDAQIRCIKSKIIPEVPVEDRNFEFVVCCPKYADKMVYKYSGLKYTNLSKEEVLTMAKLDCDRFRLEDNVHWCVKDGDKVVY